MFRNILGVLAGLIVGSVVNMGIIQLNNVLFPMADGLDMMNPDDMVQHVKALPASGFILVYVAHIGGALVGALVAAAISRTGKLWSAIVVGILFLCGGIYGVVQYPAPLWFEILDIISYIPAAFLGGRIVRGSGL